jgi:hypothetical protein
MAVGGNAVECSLKGALFACRSEGEVLISLGGDKNERLPNGNGTADLQKETLPGAVSGLVISVDHNRNDGRKLRDLGKLQEFWPFTVTLADGNTYQGNAQLGELPEINTKTTSVELDLIFEGEIKRQ